MKTDGLHSPGTYIQMCLLKCMCFILVGDYPQIKVNAFLHMGKKTIPSWKDSTQWTLFCFCFFFFSRIVDEFGSLIHTLNRSSQIFSASSIAPVETPVETVGRIIFILKVD